MSRYHICFGDYPFHYNELVQLSQEESDTTWTINSKAEPGDTALFYMQRPFTAIVGIGEVRSYAEKDVDESWPGHYMVAVGEIKMLTCPIQRKDLLLEFPDWGWLRFPRRSTVFPEKMVPKLRRLLSEFSIKVATGDSLPTPRGIPADVMEAVYKRDKGKCVFCGATSNLQFDHILPFSKGGTSLSPDNIQLLCLPCNSRKSDRFV